MNPKWYITDDKYEYFGGPYYSLDSADEVLNKAAAHIKTSHFVVPETVKYEKQRGRFVKAAKDAIQVQDACNLTGVVQSFAKVVIDVRHYLESECSLGEGTRTADNTVRYQNHPIIILWLSKIADLCGMYVEDSLRYYAATRECERIVSGDDIILQAIVEEAESDEEDAERVAAANQGFGMGATASASVEP
jgi:hypothetical protein